MGKTEGSLVYLEPIAHVYINKVTGEKYNSVTKAIQLIEPHFDSYAVSLAISNQPDTNKNPIYIGLSQNQILEYWQQLNDDANTYGTMVHNIVEEYLLANKWYFPKNEFEEKVIAGYQNLNIDEGLRMLPERVMFAEEYKIAGTSDLVIDIDNTFFDIGDWKTNRQFNYFNQYGYETLLPPFNHLQNCQYSVYTLQLSTYALMYEMEHPNKKCRQIWIGYWDKTVETFVKIPVMYLKKEAKQLLELYKYNLMK
jgi:hypothetical protein